MSSIESKNSGRSPGETSGTVVGVGYVRIPAANLRELADFYQATFGMLQIGAILDHAIMLNVGATVEEALANKNPRVIVDRRMRSNRDYGPNDNNCWVFMTIGIERVIRRAEKNGATIVMEPYPPKSRMGMVVAKFRDPSGNQIELTEVGTDVQLYLKEGENMDSSPPR
jgi:catechol 2,3-dioxygenase-like lactoylglutathione lyase family enzyme